jgi:hypothetical protein
LNIDELQRRLLTEGTEPFCYSATELDRIAALRRHANICARNMLRSIFVNTELSISIGEAIARSFLACAPP